MHRREFLTNTLGSTLALAAANFSGLALAQDTTNSAASPTPVGQPKPAGPASVAKLRGVNLGSWLVLEKWMVPDLFKGIKGPDEYSLSLELGAEAKDRLDRHRETFITDADFRWIKGCGLNAVRLPVGYWALEGTKPYIECSRFIDFALEQCQLNGLKLLLDLHGAPGSQNGWDHSGRSGEINWPKDPQNIQETLRILECFAQKYGKHPALCGIELLNEPRDVVPLDILQRFYQDAYLRIRAHADPSVSVVFHDAFRPFAWTQFMQEPAFQNVILDTHLYQCFTAKDKARSVREHLEFSIQRKEALDRMQREELPTIVGEWSLGLPGNTMRELSGLQVASVKRAYADTQLLNYEGTRGWFFWSYKLQRKSEWNFRYCVEQGLLPGSFAA